MVMIISYLGDRGFYPKSVRHCMGIISALSYYITFSINNLANMQGDRLWNLVLVSDESGAQIIISTRAVQTANVTTCRLR